MFFCLLFCFISIKNKSGFILSVKLLATFSPVRDQEVKTHRVCVYLNVTQTHTHCFFPWCEHVDLNRLGFVAVRLLGWTASNCHLRAKQKGALACCRLYLLNCAADSRNSQLLEPISLSATGVIQFFELTPQRALRKLFYLISMILWWRVY